MKKLRAFFALFDRKWLLAVLLLPVGIWSWGVVYYNLGDLFSFGETARTVLLVCWGGFFLFLFGGIFFRKAFAIPLFLLELALLIFYLSLTPEYTFAKTKWQTSWKEEPYVEFLSDDTVKLHKVRDFIYRSEKDLTPRYTEMTLDLKKLHSVDVALSHWDGLEAIAHSMLSFGFSDGQYLVFSMETRLGEGVKQGFIPGIYKQYGLLMILGTERDLFRLRTHFRKEELYLYRTNATKEQAKKMLTALLRGANFLKANPRYYNSVTKNCTTSLAPLLKLVDPSLKRDIRLLFNGFSDVYLFELGYLKAGKNETFPQLKSRRKVNIYAEKPGKEAGEEEYSRKIRENL